MCTSVALVVLTEPFIQIPGCEGRAGMIALSVPSEPPLDPNGNLLPCFIKAGAAYAFNMAELYRRLDAEMAAYARPVFVRVVQEMELTGEYQLDILDLFYWLVLSNCSDSCNTVKYAGFIV